MGEVKQDDNIYIQTSKDLLDIIQELDEVPYSVSSALSEDRLSIDQLKSLYSSLSSENKKKLAFAVQKSELLLPSPEFPERNPQLELRCQKLRREQEDREYKELTKNVRNFEHGEAPLSHQMKEINAILIALLQFVVSVGCAFTFGFLMPYYMFGSSNTGAKILGGTLAAFVVGFADLYFVIRDSLFNDGFSVKKVE